MGSWESRGMRLMTGQEARCRSGMATFYKIRVAKNVLAALLAVIILVAVPIGINMSGRFGLFYTLS